MREVNKLCKTCEAVGLLRNLNGLVNNTRVKDENIIKFLRLELNKYFSEKSADASLIEAANILEGTPYTIIDKLNLKKLKERETNFRSSQLKERA